MRHKIKANGLDWVVESAGTESYHIGEPPHHLSQKVAKLHGVDISAQRARKFTKDDLANYDKVYAMAADVLEEIKGIAGRGADLSNVELFLNESEPGANKSVPDPYYGPEPGYEHVYQLINNTCDVIVKKYK